MPRVTTTFNQKALIRIALVIAFVQFTNALEYMIFSPVFTFMAADFAVPVSFSGYVSGMYTSGAVLSGIIAFYWVDRCNKKRFLIANMVLLAIATLLTTFITRFPLLLTLRFFTGLVGGTTMGVGIGILINHTPADLRGKMLATVIASFSLVSVVGMPAILFLCTHYGWHVALWLISTLCLLALPFIVTVIPQDPVTFDTSYALPLDVDTLLFASGNALVQFSPMLIIPVLAPLMTQLLGASEGLLPWLFFGGGLAGYLSTRMTGALTSRFSALSLATGSTLVFILSLLIPFLGYPHPALFMTLFLGAAYSRLVSSSAVTIQFPDNNQRAGFSSLQTSMTYLMTTAAFFLSAFLLPDHRMALQNMDTLLALCAISASGSPIIIIILQKKLAKRTIPPDRHTTG
ncbi:MFS transporter [Klebsiella quasipneumoniae]|uniref:MFS transporter n=1 Tax=Klebsiella quasipneumoniae TaxID=1463165 RepID=UPI000C7A7264|nr:MFS transporter [Klebsiella quasipneumoniae]NHJ97380.1 MFS transporter [Klebsiella quasipneumoniae subsp. similipneumoniae]PLJ45160.1 MFS transporter [Klebsiella quasipneumoniae]HDS2589114.1 MFS transporter [Klebsiella quasipneumoniae subsp. similipneumoniae]HDS9303452.1 MFS transporter [Klebsiella quasipneumoniae subsp. similipneumoniae]HDT3859404.1 MFS transporter [Klebsiella quasipneumoniae subsp. similipneumoniae]